ncbi:hypothetical protein J4216_04640, partial [Candidatus Woesearchaeota archaeon]|nr:hypothetical protein [Candidatus Woesearchaeota archaeon]
EDKLELYGNKETDAESIVQDALQEIGIASWFSHYFEPREEVSLKYNDISLKKKYEPRELNDLTKRLAEGFKENGYETQWKEIPCEGYTSKGYSIKGPLNEEGYRISMFIHDATKPRQDLEVCWSIEDKDGNFAQDRSDPPIDQINVLGNKVFEEVPRIFREYIGIPGKAAPLLDIMP